MAGPKPRSGFLVFVDSVLDRDRPATAVPDNVGVVAVKDVATSPGRFQRIEGAVVGGVGGVNSAVHFVLHQSASICML